MKNIAKATITILILSLIIASSAYAKFKIPKFVYAVSSINNAQRYAVNMNKPIAFIFANKNTDCSLGTSASIDLFNGLKSHCIVVYVEQKDWSKIPPIAQYGLNLPDAGEYIPKTVIVTPNLDKIIDIIPYAETNQRRELIKQAQSKINNQR